MAPAQDSLDLLVTEDRAVRSLFDGLRASAEPTVTDESTHGRLSKDLVQQIAVREAAKDDVVRTLCRAAADADLVERLNGRSAERRSTIDRADHLARHVSGMDLPEEFDAAVDRLCQIVEPEIDWELAEGAGAVRTALSSAGARLRSARAVRRDAPTSLRVAGPAWYQHLPGVGWLHARWDHLQDRPTSLRHSSADVLAGQAGSPTSPQATPSTDHSAGVRDEARPTGEAAQAPTGEPGGHGA